MPPDPSSSRPRAPRTRAATHETSDPLRRLGVAASTLRILHYFALRPDARPHGRQLQRVLALGGASVQRDLERLVALRVLERSEDGHRVRYGVVAGSPAWRAFRLLIGTAADATDLVRSALSDVSGVSAAFVFGSTARGTQGQDSDVDVFILEDSTIDRRALLRQLAEVGMLLGREVNSVRYTVQAVAERLGTPAHAASQFLRELLAGPKRWVAGSAEALLPIATAAGVRLASAPESA